MTGDEDTKATVYQGRKDRTTARLLIESAGGTSGIKTRTLKNPDGSTSTLRTRNGNPEISTDDPKPDDPRIDKLVWTYDYNALDWSAGALAPDGTTFDGVYSARLDSTKFAKTRRGGLLVDGATAKLPVKKSEYNNYEKAKLPSAGGGIWTNKKHTVTWGGYSYVSFSTGTSFPYFKKYSGVICIDGVNVKLPSGVPTTGQMVGAACLVKDDAGRRLLRVAVTPEAGTGSISIYDYTLKGTLVSLVFYSPSTVGSSHVVSYMPEVAWSWDGKKLIVAANNTTIGVNPGKPVVMVLTVTRPVAGSPSVSMAQYTPPVSMPDAPTITSTSSSSTTGWSRRLDAQSDPVHSETYNSTTGLWEVSAEIKYGQFTYSDAAGGTSDSTSGVAVYTYAVTKVGFNKAGDPCIVLKSDQETTTHTHHVYSYDEHSYAFSAPAWMYDGLGTYKCWLPTAVACTLVAHEGTDTDRYTTDATSVLHICAGSTEVKAITRTRSFVYSEVEAVATITSHTIHNWGATTDAFVFEITDIDFEAMAYCLVEFTSVVTWGDSREVWTYNNVRTDNVTYPLYRNDIPAVGIGMSGPFPNISLVLSLVSDVTTVTPAPTTASVKLTTGIRDQSGTINESSTTVTMKFDDQKPDIFQGDAAICAKRKQALFLPFFQTAAFGGALFTAGGWKNIVINGAEPAAPAKRPYRDLEQIGYHFKKTR